MNQKNKCWRLKKNEKKNNDEGNLMFWSNRAEKKIVEKQQKLEKLIDAWDCCITGVTKVPS